MKVLVGNKVFLQNYEVTLIVQKFLLEADLRKEIIDNGGEPIVISGNTLRFDYSFQNPDNIKWIESQDWIIDYDEYSKKSVAELNDLLDQFEREYKKKTSDLCPRSRKTLEKHSENLLTLSKLYTKIASIGIIKRMALGELSLTFPEGYKNSSNNETNSTKKKQCFFHRIFAHSLVFGRKSTTSSAH